jgi:hypothetical protein
MCCSDRVPTVEEEHGGGDTAADTVSKIIHERCRKAPVEIGHFPEIFVRIFGHSFAFHLSKTCKSSYRVGSPGSSTLKPCMTNVARATVIPIVTANPQST